MKTIKDIKAQTPPDTTISRFDMIQGYSERAAKSMLIDAEDKLEKLGYVYVGAHGGGNIEWYAKVDSRYVKRTYYVKDF